jgi:hypothetical protein
MSKRVKCSLIAVVREAFTIEEKGRVERGAPRASLKIVYNIIFDPEIPQSTFNPSLWLLIIGAILDTIVALGIIAFLAHVVRIQKRAEKR